MEIALFHIYLLNLILRFFHFFGRKFISGADGSRILEEFQFHLQKQLAFPNIDEKVKNYKEAYEQKKQEFAEEKKKLRLENLGMQRRLKKAEKDLKNLRDKVMPLGNEPIPLRKRTLTYLW